MGHTLTTACPQTPTLTTQTPVLLVCKRDGRLVPFDIERITRAIALAVRAVRHEDLDRSRPLCTSLAQAATRLLNERYADLGQVQISQVQDAVEHVLLEQAPDVADVYISYRKRRDAERVIATDVNLSVQRLLDRDPNVANENANKDVNLFYAQRDLTAGAVAKALSLKMLPPHVANAHHEGKIHFHDTDFSPYSAMTNCSLPDFTAMLRDGYQLGNALISSPRSIQTAVAQITQILSVVSSSQYGGVTVNRIDELLAPYAELNYARHLETARRWIEDADRREEYALEATRKDIYDAMQSFEYEINTSHSASGQVPFTTIGFGLGSSPMEREVQKAILQVRRRGLGVDGRTAIFPKLVFALKRGHNLDPQDPCYDIKQLAVQCSTERMYPDIISYDKLTELTGGMVYPMGCRSFLQYWEDEDGASVYEGRMNLGVVTLNLPRVAIESGADKDQFWSILDQRLAVAGDALVYRIGRVKEASPLNAPILYMHGAFGKRLDSQGEVDEVFKNSRATVSLGYIGLYEVATVFYGPEWEANPEAKQFTLDVLRRIYDYAQAMTATHGYHFSVYSTPSESLTDRFCRIDRKKFGDIPDVTDKGYYTNSFHYDVRKAPTPFDKIDFEKGYVRYCSGGFIHYCELPSLRDNPAALEAVWDYAYDRVGYLGTNTPVDMCFECGFHGDFTATAEGFRCPGCGNTDPATTDVVKRVCGYLSAPQARPLISGRQKEIASRVKHMAVQPTATDARTF